MTISVHQPHFLPWLGYLNKALRSDVFVWLHSVQYRKNYYQNRTRIKNSAGGPFWLTLPVHASLGMRIDEVRLADPRWRDRLRKTLEQFYRKAPHFTESWPALESAIGQSSESLDDVNWRTFNALLSLLQPGNLKIVRADALPAGSDDPTRRLVEICQALGATRYIAGKGGRNYLKAEEFARQGIEVVWQTFVPESFSYRQLGDGFLPGLSVVDCLFNEGPQATREILLKAWEAGHVSG